MCHMEQEEQKEEQKEQGEQGQGKEEAEEGQVMPANVLSADKDKDGFIEYDEFLSAFNTKGSPSADFGNKR